MKQYLKVLKDIYYDGVDRPDRTKTGRRGIFCTQMRFKLSEGFPLVTTRKIFTRGMIEETLWFIKGLTNIKELQDKKINIWNNWAVDKESIDSFLNIDGVSFPEEMREQLTDNMCKEMLGEIGPMYGNLWRNAPANDFLPKFLPKLTLEELPKDKLITYQKNYDMYLKGEPDEVIDFLTFANVSYRSTVDQLNELLLSLKNNPNSARHIVTAWIPSEVPFEKFKPQHNVLMKRGALAACHAFFQCFVHPAKDENSKPRLSLQITIRSNDFPIGAPYNISQYALLIHMLAHVLNMEAYELVYNVGDCHIYLDQLPMISEQVLREPLPLPTIWLNPEIKNIYDFTIDDIRVDNYQHHAEIKYPIST